MNNSHFRVRVYKHILKIYMFCILACPADLQLPTLPSNMVCHIPDFCTGVKCCINIPLLGRSIEFHVFIDICNLKLSIGLENLVVNKSLSDYNFDTEDKISLGSLAYLRYWYLNVKLSDSALLQTFLLSLLFLQLYCSINVGSRFSLTHNISSL